MLKKIFKNMKCLAISNLYFLYFILAQTISLSLVFIVKVFTDNAYADKFMEILGPIYSKPDYLQHMDELLIGYMELFSSIIGISLLVSNLILVTFIGVKLLLENRKTLIIKKLPISKTFSFITLGLFLNLFISLIISILPKTLIENHTASTSFALTGAPFLIIIGSGIIAPIAEELVFRYGMLKNLMKINIPFALIFQAFIFGCAHGSLVQGTYAFILGLIFGISNYKEKSIIPSIIIHISINLSSVIINLAGINEYLMLCILFVISLIPTIVLAKKDSNKKLEVVQ